jgi:hypothetical protein
MRVEHPGPMCRRSGYFPSHLSIIAAATSSQPLKVLPDALLIASE